MKLEEKVCNLELGKKLKELGVKQESLFSWIVSDEISTGLYILGKDFNFRSIDRPYGHKILINKQVTEELKQFSPYSAFTVAELGEILKHKNIPVYDNHFEEWYFDSYEEQDETIWLNELKNVYGIKNEADARARALIYLIENNLIKS